MGIPNESKLNIIAQHRERCQPNKLISEVLGNEVISNPRIDFKWIVYIGKAAVRPFTPTPVSFLQILWLDLISCKLEIQKRLHQHAQQLSQKQIVFFNTLSLRKTVRIVFQ